MFAPELVSPTSFLQEPFQTLLSAQAMCSHGWSHEWVVMARRHVPHSWLAQLCS